ncbi:MAG: SDR family NAD(P)-dependent oxidoreductase [Alphaproteobacteria bacterium]|nr:SDR family NAD(P)-dependent oxidoreductase [Alphaproteobacteria bacterium]
MRAFVTGAGSGFGLALCRRLLATGHAVVACDARVAGLRARLDPDDRAGVRLQVLPLELRDPGTIATAAAEAVAAGPVDVLVNNAGYALFGTLDDADMDAVVALVDANLLGTARVTRALLPALRASRGAVVQLSSVAGRMVFPESGWYAAAKFGIEALSEALYVENAAVGVRVIVVEPGAFDTGFGARATRASLPRRADAALAPSFATWDARKGAVLAPPQDPERVVDGILAALDGPMPFVRVRVGTDARAMLAARDALGEDAWVRLMGARVGGPDVGTGLPTPEAVLAAPRDALAEAPAWHTLRCVADAGLLDHWPARPEGAAALRHLDAARRR